MLALTKNKAKTKEKEIELKIIIKTFKVVLMAILLKSLKFDFFLINNPVIVYRIIKTIITKLEI